MPLDAGKFTDAGYRFRTNIFFHTDYVYFESPEKNNTFYDFKFYNHDTYDVSEDETRISEIYLRFDIDEIEH